jgi:catechol 2,3-dioxygenase-like lactoylglutathione lyase family enzyme
MLSHVSIGVRDLERAARFYDAVLSALGYVRLWTGEAGVGYGAPGQGEQLNVFQNGEATRPGPGFHLAFTAPDIASVDAFHCAALSIGGGDNGAPGLRLNYGPTYYAAFVVDPEGHRLEAVHQ